MKNLDFGRYVLGSLVAVAMLAGCESQPSVATPDALTITPSYAISNRIEMTSSFRVGPVPTKAWRR